MCKQAVKNYVATVGNVTDGEEFSHALVHKKNLTNTDIIFGRTIQDPAEAARMKKIKHPIKNLMSIHDVEFHPDSMTVRNWSGIGKGVTFMKKDLPSIDMQAKFEGKLIRHQQNDLDIKDALEDPQLCIPPKVEDVKKRKMGQMPSSSRIEPSEEPAENSNKATDAKRLHECPTGCGKAFIHQKACDKHKCSTKKKTMPTKNIAQELFIKKLNEGTFDTVHSKSGIVKTSLKKLKNTSIPDSLLTSIDKEKNINSYYGKNFGNIPRKRVRRGDEAKEFVRQKYTEGIASGLHVRADTVAKLMRTSTKDDDVTPLFTYLEYLGKKHY